MRVTGRLTLVVAALALASGAPLAQDRESAQEFAELRGTWRYDEASSSRELVGFRVASTVVIATSPTAITLTKDGGLPEVYRLDGSETQTRDPASNAPLDPRYSFRLVAGALALISKTSYGSLPGQRTTNIVADAYRLMDADTLTVARQLSVLAEPPGALRLQGGLLNQPETLVYRRCASSC